jgi:hypothetical protein
MAEAEGKERRREEITIFFNDQRMVLPKATWTGAELREYLKVPPENRLYKEEPGVKPDLLITPEMTITLKNGDKLYDLPPGVKG